MLSGPPQIFNVIINLSSHLMIMVLVADWEVVEGAWRGSLRAIGWGAGAEQAERARSLSGRRLVWRSRHVVGGYL